MDIVAFQTEQGNCPYKKFISRLSKNENNKLMALFKLFDDLGGILEGIKKVRKLSFSCRGCYEFKPTAQIRVSFVYLRSEDQKKVCLLDGFRKKSNKWPQNKIDTTQK